ncbi:FAD-dependent oxidoreductase [Sphingomonas sp.]|uniref:FAD-dependent oxidoreductase n=1 Tax=Sphingomonas sp. TaxID=28214 RepID=UPI003B3B8B89
MLIDLDLGGPERLSADVAIIGAGAAGLTMARRLLDGGLSVVLLESGGLDYEKATADLNVGENVGQDYYDLDHARLRFFGGTTAIWGGRCAELDPIDFERRPWVPHSGWPFSHAELQPYYRQAWASFGLQPPTSADLRDVLPAFSNDELVTPIWSFDNQGDRFSFARSKDLARHPHATVVTHATVREIVSGTAGRHVEGLAVASLRGHQLQVKAQTYILAAGGIENPRILLASQRVHPAGIGNDNDLVGRFFMEHPHARGGRVVDGAAWKLLSAFGKRRHAGRNVAALIAPSAALQSKEGLLNTSLTIAPSRPTEGRHAWAMRAYLHAKHRADPTRVGRALWKGVKRTVHAAQKVVDPVRPWLLHKTGQLDLALFVRAEQAPNPDSRVVLSRETDALGVPRVALDWRTVPLDVDSVSGLVSAVGRELSRLQWGDVEAAPWLKHKAREWVTDPLISTHPIGGYHHMGTTRMSADAKTGVTDGFGRVHGMANLYIAGSSLFPTSGWANPTLTLVALAMRTADHILGDRARQPQAA